MKRLTKYHKKFVFFLRFLLIDMRDYPASGTAAQTTWNSADSHSHGMRLAEHTRSIRLFLHLRFELWAWIFLGPFLFFSRKANEEKNRSGAVAMPPPFLFHRGTLPLKLLRVTHWKLAVQSLAGKVAPWCFDFDFFPFRLVFLDRLREPTLHHSMQCWGKARGVWCQEYGSVLAPLDLAALEHMLLHFIWRIYIGVIVFFFFFALFDTVALRPVTSPR